MAKFYFSDRDTKPAKAPKPTLTDEQRAALQRYANENGRRWKSELSLAWSTGHDEREEDSAELRQVRNTFGPRWLYTKCKIRPEGK